VTPARDYAPMWLERAEALEAAAYAGNVEVLEDGEWRPFIPVHRPAGEKWDAVCIHAGKAAVNTYPAQEYVLAYMRGDMTAWHELRTAYYNDLANQPGPVINPHRLIPEKEFQ